MEDELTAFRAAHASVREAIAKCESPTWAIRLAFDEAADRKAVIGIAALTARRVLPKDTMFDFVNPVPNPLEVAELWASSSKGTVTTTMRADFKSFGLAILLVFSAVAVLVWAHALSPWLQLRVNKLLLCGISAVAIYVLARPIKALLIRAAKRRASHLDEQAALTIVLDKISEATAKTPPSAEVMARLRFALDDLLAATA